MLSPFEVVLNAAVVLLLPLAVTSLITGALPPETTWLGKLYRMDRHLHLVNDLFLLALCATCIARLARHFGAIDAATYEMVERFTLVPFMILWAVFMAMLVRAIVRLRRKEKRGA